MGLFGGKPPASKEQAAPTQPGTVTPLRSNTETESVPQHFAPGTEIAHHPELIEHFQDAHRALATLHDTIQKQVEADQFADAQQSLVAFQRALADHLLEEHIKLYTYLAKCLTVDPDNQDLMAPMKAEMGQAASAIMRTVKQYAQGGVTRFDKRQFLKEWDLVGTVLTDRLEREERLLYPLYVPPSSF